jgi:hypothetical protein
MTLSLNSSALPHIPGWSERKRTHSSVPAATARNAPMAGQVGERGSDGYMSAKGRGGLFLFILLYTTLYAGFGVVSPFLPTLLQA